VASAGGSLRDAWEEQAENWATFARTGEIDNAFWLHNLPRFLELLPPAGRLTLDVGCGEGRLGRVLRAAGHRVVAVDGSPTMARFAAEAEDSQSVVVADAAALPVCDAVADLGIAFMSLMDIDDLEQTIRELGRVTVPGGRLCLAIVHPINSAGRFDDETAESPFTVTGSYLECHGYIDVAERENVTVTFHSEHRPLEAYSRALEDAGFVIEAIREDAVDDEYAMRYPSIARWQRVPLFLHLRAVRAG